jgi:hypothetical protein
MRGKLIIGILSLGTLGLLALILISPGGDNAPTGQPDSTATGEVNHAVELQRQEKSDLALPDAATNAQPPAIARAKGDSRTEASDISASDAKHEAFVEARIAELQDLSRKTDSAALKVLLSEVKNPDQEIRQAALDAISQSGNRSAIPGLQAAAAQTEDATEKQTITEVIEFLKLPTLTEILQKQGATGTQKQPTPPPR